MSIHVDLTLGETRFICWITPYQLTFFSGRRLGKRHGEILLTFCNFPLLTKHFRVTIFDQLTVINVQILFSDLNS